jgi:hypothetical protein
MASDIDEWRPGSFTKNFSWGAKSEGLRQLHQSIRIGFDNKMEDVPREEFRSRVARSGRPDYIPINFFLFNKIVDGIDYLIADELVFQALTQTHSARFDKLALFTFNFSYAGIWRDAAPYQRRPALWAYHYVRDRVNKQLNWNTAEVSANDIERFVSADNRYRAATARKLSTNLNYLYSVGRLSEFSTTRVERWWVDALFLAMDRLIEDRGVSGQATPESEYANVLSRSGFQAISGRQSLERELATKHLLTLYIACGSRERFSEKNVRERTLFTIPDVQWLVANDTRPQGAVHPTNPHILKTIPRICAMLALYSGFDVIDADELDNFDPEEFVRSRTKRALERLAAKNIRPTMSAEELMKITRDR